MFSIPAESSIEGANLWLEDWWFINSYQAFLALFILGLFWSIFNLIKNLKNSPKNKYNIFYQVVLLLAWLAIIFVHFKLWELIQALGKI